jgi:predicted dehydrogenase
MKLAVLGTDADIVRLVAAAAAEGHDLVWLGDVRPEDERTVSRFVPRLDDRSSQWELLLDRNIADAVLVGRGTASDELRSEQLKRLAAEKVPLLLTHPATESVLTYYELDMIRRETGGVLRHFNPMAGHPILADLAEWMRHGHPTVGAIHQLTCERRTTTTQRANVMRLLARDVEVMASVAGSIRRVSAIGPGIRDASFAALQIQMTTDGPASLRWAVSPPSSFGSGLQLTLVGEDGSVSLTAPEDSTSGEAADWRLETNDGTQHDTEQLAPHHAPRVAIQQLLAAVSQGDRDGRPDVSTWESATRAMEVVDAVELSLQKGRTIDVHQQQLTQQLAFRGTMAALGCGLLLVGFVVTVFVTLLGGAEGAGGQKMIPAWHIMLAVVLLVFLLLQAVPLLASKAKKKPARE